ncbi:hypothetical protein RhiirA4_513533 [Rhizophagus irregularis]|uniref:Uncharacterized protein n=1 Tax=Rhizophagus irregularis TaxID=588596 RepID=A0A2I1HIT2_9GLOM|nr:hypothetical protein RhiirA4_513533 [Rhizophagus irregularis]
MSKWFCLKKKSKKRAKAKNCTNSMGPYIAAARDYILQSVLPYGGGDTPEDVLGGLNEAITKMNWKNGTRVLLHIGDSPPHVDNIFIGYPWNEKLSFPLFSNSRRNPNNKLSENIFVILEL